jgi:hypothetical protein
MKLAAISGVDGVLTDKDIERVRKLALAERARLGPARATTTRTRTRPLPRGRTATAQPRRHSA